MQSKTRVLVTGADGFIGSHLTKKLLEDGYEVITPQRSRGFDVTVEKDVLGLPKCEVVIHLAARTIPSDSWTTPKTFLETNIGGTLNMLKYCETNRARMIFASSYLYGNSTILPTAENQFELVENPYAVSKLAAEKLCYVYSQRYFFPVVALRAFNPYGPGQSKSLLICQMIIELMTEDKITVLDARPKRDFLYIDDLVDAYLAALEHPQKEFAVYNVGSGKNFSVREIAEMLIKISGKKAETVDKKIERPNEIMETLADITKIRKELGWRPKTDIESGLKKTYGWYLKNVKA